ncbi:hypothetical protein KO516_08115 [Citreicella sp. C3M06]|uniref:hypothetical protein n=1 Tax=Citreicella sp. C3M06 TaxID=2841564 RepID=UPI001C08397D|nr:hypothetical protein [Citreicella sp. C3M06]MBU2960779.1 hypothetical protein [Citreicella sp. C3M06]
MRLRALFVPRQVSDLVAAAVANGRNDIGMGRNNGVPTDRPEILGKATDIDDMFAPFAALGAEDCPMKRIWES